MSGSKWYSEDHEISALWSWVFIVAFSASIAAFGWLVYWLVPDGTRQWDFGQLPDTPAESVYSTEEPRSHRAPQRQLLRLPEAQPLPAEAPTARPGGAKR